MMIKKIFQYLSLCSILLLFANCENENTTEQEFLEVQLEYSARKITKTELNQQSPEITKQVESYNRPLLTGRDNDFEVLTDNIGYLEKGDYKSYTFPIVRKDSETNGFENLLISKQKDNSFKPILVRYSVTKDEQRRIGEGELIDFNGKVEFLDIDFDVESLLLTSRGHLNECPPGECCETQIETSRGTGLPILTYKIVPCGDEGSGDDQGSGGGSGGNGGGNGSSGGSGADSGNGGRPNGGGTGSGGSGGSGGNPNADGPGPSDDDAPCTNCIEDGTIPIPIDPTLDNETFARVEFDKLVDEGLINSFQPRSGESFATLADIDELRDILTAPYDPNDAVVTDTDVAQNGKVTHFIRFNNILKNRTIEATMRLQLHTPTKQFEVTAFESSMSGINLLQEYKQDNLIQTTVTESIREARIEVRSTVKTGIKIPLLGIDFRISTRVAMIFSVNIDTGEVLTKFINYNL